MRLIVRVCLFVVLNVSVVAAQVATGVPPFSSIGGGPFDQVNLGNLNVHFAVPVLSKAGRGVPFVYNLSYDSSVWYPSAVSGTQTWTPVQSFGWSGSTAVATGYVTWSYLDEHRVTRIQDCEYITWNSFTYVDPFGVQHPFGGKTEEVITNSGTCPGAPITSFSASTNDGSGYSINVTFYNSVQINSPSGKHISPPTISGTGAASYVDTNGNEITVDASGHFKDTLGNTVLTVAGSASSAQTFTYTNPQGGTSSYTMNYQPYTVKTKFGVTGVSEYGPLSNYLVSSISLPDGTAYEFTYEETPSSAACTPLSGTYSGYCTTGRLASVTLPTGGTISYTYTGGSNGVESDGSTAGLTRSLSGSGSWEYSRSLVSGTPGPGSTWNTTITDPASNQTVLNFAEDSSNGTTAAPTYNLYEALRKVYQGSASSGTLLATTTTCYNANYTSCSAATVASPITQTDAYYQPASGSIRLSELQYNGSFSGSGLVSQDNEYDYGVSLGAAPGNTHLIKQTITAYASLGNGIIGAPASVTVNDWSSGTSKTIAYTSYSYDQSAVTTTSGTPQHISITGSRGNLTTLATEASTATTLYQTFTYYDTGNLSTSTGLSASASSPGPQTTYNYGSGSCGNSFPTSISEPLSLSKSETWNCTGGVVTQTTDENAKTVTTAYTDANFWRPSSVTDQETNETSITYSGQTGVEAALVFNGGNSASDIRVTADEFGRPMLNQRRQSPTGSNYDTYETDYNNEGFPSRSTMPFSASAGGTNSTAPSVQSTYDALGRKLSVVDNDGGTVSSQYVANDILQTTSGAQSFKKQFEYDGLGRLTSVCEISTTLSGVGTCGQTQTKTGYWTKYTYDALGHLLTVTQNAQASSGHQTRTYVYDMLGRLTSESNPETSNSGTNGTVSYTYDAISPCGDGTNYAYPGDLVQKDDNAGNKTCFAYDALNRLVKAGNTSVANTTLRQYVYDSKTTYPSGVTVSNGKTHLVEAKTVNTSSLSTPVTDEFFSYSPRGELTDVYEATPHSGGYYHTSAAYWASGALQTLSGIPSVPTLYYGASGGSGLDGEGRYTQVTSSSTPNPVTGVTYSTTGSSNYLGALTGVTYGSSDSDSFSYDPNTGRQIGYTFSVNGHADAGTLTWNSSGTLASLGINDAIPGTGDTQNCSYTYDDLMRAAGVNCGTAWQQTFNYDAFGNVSKTGNLSFQPTYSSATNQFGLSGITVQYDANGNLLTDNLNTYTWDKNWGTMNSVNSITAIYDALGDVVEQQAGSTNSEILYSPVGKVGLMNGGTLVKAMIPLPGGGTAVYTSAAAPSYRHPDWLGSSRLTSMATRTVAFETAYAPFGEQYGSTGTNDASYTGQNSDTASSLYDFFARRLSPSQGRWISPDPSGLAFVDFTNPQSFNRYAYVVNGPLSQVDPLGLGAGCWIEWQDYYVQTPDDGEVNEGSYVMICDSNGGGGGGNGGGRGGGGGVGGTNSSAPNNPVPQNPCAEAGKALPPSAYAQEGKAAANNPLASTLDLNGFPRGGPLDAQPLGGSRAYGNYVYGVYMRAAGFPLFIATAGAEYYSWKSNASYGPADGQMSGSVPSANIANITNGYNAQKNGTVCHF